MIVDSSADDAVAFAALADEDIERSIKPNFYQQYREIRKKNEDVLNRLRSIFVDYAFVEETIETLGVTNILRIYGAGRGIRIYGRRRRARSNLSTDII